MTKINTLLTRHEGTLDRLKATFTDRDSLKIAKEAFSSRDLEHFKYVVKKIGVDKFLRLYDDRVISVLKTQLELIKAYNKFIQKYPTGYKDVKSLSDFMSVLKNDPVFKYLNASDSFLKKLGMINDSTVSRFKVLMIEAKSDLSSNNGVKLAKFITDLYNTCIVNQPPFDESVILKDIEKIKSGAKISPTGLFSMLSISGITANQRLIVARKSRNNFVSSVLFKGAVAVALVPFILALKEAFIVAFDKLPEATLKDYVSKSDNKYVKSVLTNEYVWNKLMGIFKPSSDSGSSISGVHLLDLFRKTLLDIFKPLLKEKYKYPFEVSVNFINKLTDIVSGAKGIHDQVKKNTDGYNMEF